MNREQILNTFKDLGKTQGFYQRLYETLNEDYSEYAEEFLQKLEEQEFKDVVDMILYLED